MLLHPEKKASLPHGFVPLSQVDERFIIDLRYATEQNFLGTMVDGYEAYTCIATFELAEALKKAHDLFLNDGYRIIIYDTYRPQIAVDHFYRWSLDPQDQKMKEYYYPRHDKKDLFELGYMAKRSSHTRGSAVDFSLIEKNNKQDVVSIRQKELLDGYILSIVNDGSIDMGTSFDMLDLASHHGSSAIPLDCHERRNYVKDIMMRCGFLPYSKEWWHYSLKDEPYPNTYF